MRRSRRGKTQSPRSAEQFRVPVLHYDEDFDRIAAMIGQRTRPVAPRASIWGRDVAGRGDDQPSRSIASSAASRKSGSGIEPYWRRHASVNLI
jgi:hypothetical protein